MSAIGAGGGKSGIGASSGDKAGDVGGYASGLRAAGVASTSMASPAHRRLRGLQIISRRWTWMARLTHAASAKPIPRYFACRAAYSWRAARGPTPISRASGVNGHPRAADAWGRTIDCT